jgi:hypothetical protein
MRYSLHKTFGCMWQFRAYGSIFGNSQRNRKNNWQFSAKMAYMAIFCVNGSISGNFQRKWQHIRQFPSRKCVNSCTTPHKYHAPH